MGEDKEFNNKLRRGKKMEKLRILFIFTALSFFFSTGILAQEQDEKSTKESSGRGFKEVSYPEIGINIGTPAFINITFGY